jgi:uncharacterized protein (DUF2147 family)
LRIPALLLILACSAVCHAATGVLGDWKTSTGSIVRVAPCGPSASQQVCLKIVQLAPSAPETTDKQNPDAALRNRSLCGLTIGTGFHQDDPSHLSDGHLYDPKSGHDYRGTIALDGANLKLHGYIGISLFGRTEIWHRASVVPSCH